MINDVIEGNGLYGDALRKVMYDPFEKATDIKVVTVQEARSGPRIKAQGEAGKACSPSAPLRQIEGLHEGRISGSS